MARTNASQGSRRDARNPAAVRWPRIGVRIEGNCCAIVMLKDGEGSDLPSAVRIAEPEDAEPSSLVEAVQQAAASLADSIRRAARAPVNVVVRV